ncbi:MAG: adenosylmethionine decarboxylase [Alphaproteobacteria bacterium]|mgnify:FL=1|nr:adenosylmethionine decarboxylase [Alphaproteobacteria bacterium]
MARLAKKVAAINEALAVSVQTPARTVPVLVSANDAEQGDQPKDYWITRNGVKYAGQHLTIDLWEAEGLDDEKRIQQAFLDAIKAAGATLLHIHTHVFEPNGGISGVAVLSESHISCHTWPEKGFAAFDVFMCGDAQPELAIPVFEAAFKPKRVVVEEIKRGAIYEA